jgi:hypothetical protein
MAKYGASGRASVYWTASPVSQNAQGGIIQVDSAAFTTGYSFFDAGIVLAFSVR